MGTVVDEEARTRVDRWRGDLDRLYTAIEGWVSTMSPSPEVDRLPFRVVEKSSGPYQVDELAIRSGGVEASVVPVATWVLGADGRADLRHHGIWYPLVLIRDRGGWFHVPNAASLILEPLDGDLFRQLLSSVL